mmetsp:Transcript_18865/g.43282  ORF Transcript_18865/g.43282 Transcript_18865/m.43282 type:complete len:201 (-) Transcript_18865:496-1098(-)
MACEGVTTLPAITCSFSCVSLRCFTISIWYSESPWDESTTITSTPASTSAAARSRSSGRVPIAAPTKSCFETGFFEALGYSWFFNKSVRAINATSSSLSLTTGSFPFFVSFRISFASCKETPCLATDSFSRGVMISLSFIPLSVTNDTSRDETMPTSFPFMVPQSVIGIPEYPCLALSSITSDTVEFGQRQIGSVMNPFS